MIRETLNERWSAESELIDNTNNEFVYFNIVLDNGEVIEGRMLDPCREVRDAGNNLDA